MGPTSRPPRVLRVGRDNGYLSDVTGVPAIDDTTIAAVGLARANPFTAMPTFHPEGNYYVITSNNPGSGQVVTLSVPRVLE
jgi:hypothetical protein